MSTIRVLIYHDFYIIILNISLQAFILGYSKRLDCEDCHRLAYVFDDVSARRQFFDDGEEIAGVQFPLVKVWVLWVLAQQQRVNALYLQQTTFIFYNYIKTMPVSARYKYIYDMEKI